MSLQGNLAVWAMQNRVETTFDEKEFLEGAKDAWCAGTCLHANGNIGNICEPVYHSCHVQRIDTVRCMLHLICRTTCFDIAAARRIGVRQGKLQACDHQLIKA